jgi:hypothetical protein
LDALIRLRLSHRGTYEIRKTDGWTNLHLEQQYFRRTSDAGGLNLVIFDADTPHHPNGGHTARRRKLEGVRQGLGLTFKLFLLPDNRSDGNLETLLEQLVPPTHRRVLTCYDALATCLAQPAYQIPDPDKKRFFVYMDVMPLSGQERKRFNKSHGDDRLYENPAYWNLEATVLDPLVQFLKQHLQLS